jgi:hypothetical protein
MSSRLSADRVRRQDGRTFANVTRSLSLLDMAHRVSTRRAQVNAGPCGSVVVDLAGYGERDAALRDRPSYADLARTRLAWGLEGSRT